MTNSYNLQTVVHRAELVEWLESLPNDRRDTQVEQALALGHQMLTFIQAGAGEESMKRFFRPVLNTMDQLSDQLETMMSFSAKSQRLGELGEAMVASQLQAAFPNDHFQIQSSTGHQADVQALFRLDEGVEKQALVEVKLYSNDVPSKELNKFRRDLAEQRQRYGLMVSLTSRLSGITGPFSIEAKDDYVAVFLPNAGKDGHLLYWGAALLKALMQYELRSGTRIRSDAIALAFERLQADLAELKQAATQVGQIKDAVRRAQQTVNKALDNLVDDAISAEVRLRHLVQRFENNLLQELQDLPRTTVAVDLPQPAAPDVIEAFLDGLVASKDKRAPGYRAIYATLQNTDVVLGFDENQFVFMRGSTILARTASTKTRVDVKWSLGDAKRLTLDVGLETLKSGHIVMNGKDVGRLAERLAERLTE